MVKRRSKKSNKAVDQPAQRTQKQEIGILDLPPEILEQIFYYLRLRDLLTCRLVHPSWRKSATKPCREQTKEIQFAYNDEPNRVLLMRDFMCLLNKSTDLQSFPIANVRVRIGPPPSKFPPKFEELSPDEITNFFDTIASFVTEFTVVVSLGNATDNSYKFLPKDLKFEKLKYLTLCGLPDDDDAPENEERSLLNFLRGVVENAEALNQIALKIGDRCDTPTTAIRMCVEECGIRSKLKLLPNLDIEVNVAKVDWVTLGNMGLKLQRLRIMLEETTEEHANTLKGFLQSQADTLTALEVKHRPGPNGNHPSFHLTQCSISFPNMKHLKSLEIISTLSAHRAVDWRIFKILNLSYSGQFPALKQLNLKQATVIWPCFLRYNGMPSDTLEELILSKYCYDENVIINVALSFPKIKKLHVAAEENMLFAVYEHMKNLEDLTLYTTAEISIDYIISGVDPKECPYVVGSRVEKEDAWRKLMRRSTRKSMYCLENLKVLRLKTGWIYSGENVKNMLEFSDISVLVFREMQSLKVLDLGVRKFSNLHNELALLEELRKTLDVSLRGKERKKEEKKEEKLCQKEIDKRTVVVTVSYVPKDSDSS